MVGVSCRFRLQRLILGTMYIYIMIYIYIHIHTHTYIHTIPYHTIPNITLHYITLHTCIHAYIHIYIYIYIYIFRSICFHCLRVCSNFCPTWWRLRRVDHLRLPPWHSDLRPFSVRCRAVWPGGLHILGSKPLLTIYDSRGLYYPKCLGSW